MNTDEFFDATPELQTIRQWAYARYAAVWAVFGGVLLRVAASVGPEVQLPGVIGGRASLNLLCAFVAPSGGGKGISDKVARLAWPAPIIERPIGSGEGIAATFMPPKKEGVERITRAIINVPEIDTLTGVSERQGSILLPQLKSAAMGEQLGQANSSEATTRIIAPHSYRLCLSVGAQPTHTKVLFADTTGGTPQRFLWFPTIDPEMPSDVIDDPEPLDTRLPFWKPGEDGVLEIVYGPDHIRQTIIAAHIARQRGQQDALDGHAMLTRLKVAAVLAILHHRHVVSDFDWDLSGVVMEMSTQTREWVLGEAKRADRAKVRDRALSRAAGEEFVSDRKFGRTKVSIVRWLSANGELTLNEIKKRARSDWRNEISAALSELVDEGFVVEIETQKGHRYRLSASPQVDTGPPHETPGQSGVDPGPGVDLKGDAHVGTESAVIDLDGLAAQSSTPLPSAPLHAVVEPSEAENTVTAPQWMNAHISELITAGTTTVTSLDVYDAGRQAGFQTDNLRYAAKKCPLISVAARKNGSTIWNLGSGSENTVVSCPQWLDGWLRDQGDWVQATDVFEAGAEAGYERATVRSAANRIGVRKRGQSTLTEWTFNPDFDIRESA